MQSIKIAVVAAFLKEFKKLAVRDKGIYVINRRENRDALVELGITEQIRKNEIMSLSIDDYSSGPEPDVDMPGDIWVFGKEINGHGVYIKLKIADVGGKRIAKCISFHKANFPQRYPLR